MNVTKIEKTKCGAKTRQGTGTCQKPAGWGTENAAGRCRLHGGATPIKHGRYSNVQRTRVRELYENFKQDPEPLSLLDEVALLRAILVDLMERWDLVYGEDGALLAWFESYKENPSAPDKPRHLPDFASISQVVDRVGAMVDRIMKHKKEGSVSMQTMMRVVEQFGVEVARAVSAARLDSDVESELLKSIEARWNSVSLESK